MSETTKISWCHSTVNFWSGCTKVSPGCAHCYAETLSNRKMTDAKGNLTIGRWGKGQPRKLHESAFKLAHKLNRKPWVCDECGHWLHEPANENGRMIGYCDACETVTRGHRRRIFSLSLGDWLDPEVPIEWLARMLDTVRQCDQVTWILCTKRPELWQERLLFAKEYGPEKTAFEYRDWVFDWVCNACPPKNVWMLTSVENQEMADKRIPELLKIPAVVRGLSCEPLLGPVSILPWVGNTGKGSQLDWVICGGES